ncbi:MAG: hypothetical protein BLM47_13000 [Candidatus Reconcilbacillus cellulovorans]|uniref:Uncharacterized protein n=1 Tax=Candidatus Reconcilbacillus cellulovorans TaxID=1906605 RepID=A0A2A6DXQ0_9BACL|nr:MAG: hypothetical protein BLM47_13000 [Candidatus Reconcilbacillus cellulovorans]
MKKKALIPFLITCFLIISIKSYKYLYKPNRVAIGHGEYAFDITDKELLVGWADNVFIGTVLKKEKEIKDDVSPLSIYEVKVEENIKGNLYGNIKISHRGGYDNDKKVLFRFEGDDYLKVGAKYLFVSRYDSETSTHRIVPVEGDIALDSKEKEQKVKKEFERAKVNQKNYLND